MLFSICIRAIERFRPRAIEDVNVGCDDSTEETASREDLDDSSWLERTCDSLRANTLTLKELEIDSEEKSLDDGDIITLCDALNSNEVVTRLIFRNVDFGENENIHLAQVLQNTNSISTVHLEETRGIGQLAVATALHLNTTSSVRVLHLKGNLIDQSSSQAIGQMLKTNRSLSELKLCHNSLDADSVSFIAQGLKRNYGLRVLDLLGNGLDDVGVSKISNALAHNESLEFLCLDFNDFGYFGVKSIASMLCTNQHIKELHLFGNRIDSCGAQTLADALLKNSSLETLILSFNQIGDAGAAALAKALTVNKSLTKIWFPSNSVGIDGLRAFGECLPRMKVLEELHVGHFFDSDAVEALLKGLRLNTSLSVLYMESPVHDETSIEDKVDFYLRLNKSGRSLLKSPDAPTSLWAKALERANVNEGERGAPDVLYFMLRQRPDLFNFVRR